MTCPQLLQYRLSAHRAHMFNSRYKAVNKKLDTVRKSNELDVSRYAFPVVKLKEQDMITSALAISTLPTKQARR